MQSLEGIAVFVTVVEAGSFTAAADRLEVSQPAVSRAVTALEKRLGVRLLQRTTRRLQLTEAGGDLYRRAARALAELEEAQHEVARHQTEPRGTLRVSAPTSFTISWLGHTVGEFLRRHPGVRLDLQLEDRHVDLVADGFDLAIRVATLDDSQLVAQRLAPARTVLCAAPEYLARRGTPREPDDLLQHDCIVYTNGAAARKWRLNSNGRTLVMPVQGPVLTNNGLVEKFAALDGLGIVLLPVFYVAAELRSGRLRVVLPEFPPVELGVYAVYPERRGLSAKVRAYVQFLKEQLGPVPPWERDLPRPASAAS
jgi:DNA-binding transcriptional LysR family regulator